MRQEQFLNVLDEGAARALWQRATAHLVSAVTTTSLGSALGRIIAEDERAVVDVPAFDRSNMDGFAVRASDTFGAEELSMLSLAVSDVRLGAGQPAPPGFSLTPGRAVPIATGAMIPRGADAVLMVENTVPEGRNILINRPVVPGENISFAGSDLGRGDLVVRAGTRLSARETGVLASVGVDQVSVFDPPRITVISTGDEVVPPGADLALGQVYDSNQRVLLDSITEIGGVAVAGGIVGDNEADLRSALRRWLNDPACSMILLSGGTSKGEGDLNAQVVHQLAEPEADGHGVVVHGVALKPGKPLLLAVLERKPVVVLPGFPTSAIFTFHEFVAPLIRRMSGDPRGAGPTVQARAPMRIDGAAGRTSYVLVDLIESGDGLSAYPLGAGSGSVTAFARADGFIRIPADVEFVEEGADLDVRLIDPHVRPADLVVIGSHCVGLDFLLGLVAQRGFSVKMIPVGSNAGVTALARGEGDVAGVHLLDETTGIYNAPFLVDDITLVKGYGRRQGVVFRPGDAALAGDTPSFLDAIRNSDRRMVNRNRGAGTRILLDGLLEGARPEGYLHQARTHHAVAAAVEQGRADWGMTLDSVAAAAGLEFRFIANEEFDLAVRRDRAEKPAVAALLELLADTGVRGDLRLLGFEA